MIFRLTSLVIAALFWMVAGVVALFVLMMATAVLGFAIGPVFLFGGPIGSLLLLIVLGITARRVRERRATLVLSQLEQAVRLNLPLPAMLRASELSERGRTGRRFGRLREAIESGDAVGDAVDRHVPELPRRAVALIAAGERVGQLPATLGRLVRESRRDQRDHEPEQALVYGYVIVVLLTLAFIFTGITVFIMPSFREIFADFDATMPWMTEVTFAWGQTPWPKLLLLATVVLALAAAGHATWQLVHAPDRQRQPGATAVDYLLWCIPGVCGAVRDRVLADAFAFVADALRAGQPLDTALSEASELPHHAIMRRRLRRWADAVHAGAEPGEAARRARLPGIVSGIIGPAQTGANIIRGFAFLSRYHRLRFSRLVAFGRAAILPIAVLLAAVLVGWLVLSMFLPMVHLLESVTEDALRGGRV